MIDLKKFRENSIARGLCQGYTDMWDDDKSKRQLFELACDPNSVKFMAKSLSEGWGLSPEYIADKFRHYINGKYICEYKNGKGNGYESAMLCMYNEKEFIVNTTLLCVLSSNTTLEISPRHICEIHVAGESNLHIEMGENSQCYIYIYGSNPVVSGDLTNKRLIIKRELEEK